MNARTYIASFDNGVTGSMALLGPGVALFTSVPTKKTKIRKTGDPTTRIDHAEVIQWLKNGIQVDRGMAVIKAYVERPYSGRNVKTVSSGARSHESVLIALELLAIDPITIDSREWQSVLLPGVTGSANLKKASLLKGLQLYPALAPYIRKQGDADSLLIAHHFSR